mmetsp:Transcript_111984/g.357469  ORF Transcript_111984/g.357469 Transcript_111984/m.357469 type:complete len:99 (-) Transcript_111984:221-517(-)
MSILRDLCVKPPHGLEHMLQWDHEERMQSSLTWQGTPTLQLACSIERPTGGWPQSSACRFTLRIRHVVPFAQVLEQASHEDHGAHSPSVQLLRLQGCV